MTQEFTKGVSTRLDEAMFNEIKELAQKEHRPLSNMVRVLLIEALHLKKLGVNDKELYEYVEAKRQFMAKKPMMQTPPPVPD